MCSKSVFLKASAIFVSSLTAMAFAKNVKCSNPEATVTYDARVADFGSNGESDIYWSIDGTSLMQESSLEIITGPGGRGPGFKRPTRQVTSAFTFQTDIAGKMDNSDPYVSYKVKTYSAKVKVTSIATQETEFNGYVICESRQMVRTAK